MRYASRMTWLPQPVRLYESTIPSGNAYKVRLALAQLGLPCEIVELDILATPPETRRPEFLAKNANGRIPLLELADGTFLPESNAILYYLAQTSGSELWPHEPLEQAQVLQWLFFEQYSHEPFIAVLKFWTLWGGLHNKRPDELARLKEQGQHALRVMDGHLASRRFFAAERYTIADIALYAYTHSAGDVGFDLQAVPHVRAWLQRVREQPGHVAIKADPTRA